MEINALSDKELLTLLIGKKAVSRYYRGHILPLITGTEEHDPHPTLVAVMECASRVLSEKIRHGPSLNSPTMVRDYLRMHFVGKQREVFVGVFLDAQNRAIATEDLFHGTLTQTSVYPREVVKRALRHNAAACIFAHNHPSGVAEPSRADEALTATLKRALALVDVNVLDHFVVGSDLVVSFAERGVL